MQSDDEIEQQTEQKTEQPPCNLFGIDPKITQHTLEGVLSNLPHDILPRRRMSHFLHAFVLHIFRMFVSGMTLDDRVPKKLKRVFLQRIGANVRFGNRGRNYVQNGGIFKECALIYQKIPQISWWKISRESTENLNIFRVNNIENTFGVFTTALCPNRGVSAHEVKTMLYLLWRVCASLLIEFRIDQNDFDFADEECDCLSSYYEHWKDNSRDSRKKCFELLEKLLERLDMFEQQLSMYPSMKRMLGIL